MKHVPNTYYVTVIEDMDAGEIIGSATLFVEQKFIRECAKVAFHIQYNVLLFKYPYD
jgi:hypothetical protein